MLSKLKQFAADIGNPLVLFSLLYAGWFGFALWALTRPTGPTYTQLVCADTFRQTVFSTDETAASIRVNSYGYSVVRTDGTVVIIPFNQSAVCQLTPRPANAD